MLCSAFASVIGSVRTVCFLAYIAIQAAKVSVPWQHEGPDCAEGGCINAFRVRGWD